MPLHGNISTRDRRRLRIGLALLRISLLFCLTIWLTFQIGLHFRSEREQGDGLNRKTVAPLDLPFIGTTVMLEDLSADERHDALVQLQDNGVGWVRQRFDWGAIEPSSGRYDWQQIDEILAAIDDAGLTPVVVLDGSPAWARAAADQAPTDNPHAPPADPLDFVQFAADFARRYGKDVRYYQIWHEPNIAPHWGNRHIEPVQYAQLLIEASMAIRSADADAIIFTAALAPTADRGHTAIDEAAFLQRLYATGIQSHVDAVAVEPFGFGYSAHDSNQRRDVLNFQRAAWVRRAMLAAGDGETPLVATSYGWNRWPASPWRTVTPENQRQYVADALEIGWSDWPWLAGMGWAMDQPAADMDDPVWGFALTDELLALFGDWAKADPGPRTGPQPRFSWQAVVLFVCMAVVLWRGLATMSLLPWQRWRTGYLRWSAWVQAGLWLGLLVLYYFAAWPPLVALWIAVAAVLIAMQPQVGLWLAALFLPFTFQHKEVHLVDATLFITPTQAVVLASLPTLALRINSARARLRLRPLDWFGLTWLALSLFAAANVWHWPGYADGLIALVITPLLLYAMLRLLVDTRHQRLGAAAALFAGGLLVAGLGLADWLLGGGTEADAVRRLVGPYFSPNHAALYLERTLFLGMGLWLALRSAPRPPILGEAVYRPGIASRTARQRDPVPSEAKSKPDVPPKVWGLGGLLRSAPRPPALLRLGFVSQPVGQRDAVPSPARQEPSIRPKVGGLGGLPRWLLLMATALVMLALLLTASRGALLLGLPAGLLLFVWLLSRGPQSWRRLCCGSAPRPPILGEALLRLGFASQTTRQRDTVPSEARHGQGVSPKVGGLGGLLAGLLLLLLLFAVVAVLLFWPRLSNTVTLVERLAVWSATLRLWCETPWVGVGPGGFYWRYPAFMPTGASLDANLLHPHNIWLETGSMWGITGLVWLFALLIWTVRNIWSERALLRCCFNGAVAIGLLAGLFAGLAHGQVDAYGALADIAAWNWLALGLWRSLAEPFARGHVNHPDLLE